MTALRELSSLFEDLLRGADRLRLGGLSGPALAYVLSELARASSRPLFIICPDVDAAVELSVDLEFFHDGGGETAHRAAAAPPEAREQPAPPAGGLAGPLFFPPYEVTPYDGIQPDHEVTRQRLKVLSALCDEPARLLVTTVTAAMQRVPPRRALASACLHLAVGSASPLEALAAQLARGGYRREAQVEAHGDFSIRGGILDVYPPGAEHPVRCEFVGNELESMRLFDLATQKSLRTIAAITLEPVREFLVNPEDLPAILARLRRAAQAQDLPDGERAALEEHLREGSASFPSEALLPLCHGRLDSIWDYLDPDCIQVLYEPERLADVARRAWEGLSLKYRAARGDGRLALDPPQHALRPELLPGLFAQTPRLEVSELAGGEGASPLRGAVRLLSLASFRGRFSSFIDQLRVWLKERYRIIIVCSSQPGAERLQALLREHDLGASIAPRFSALRLGGPWAGNGQGEAREGERRALVAQEPDRGLEGAAPPARRRGAAAADEDAALFEPRLELCLGRISGAFQFLPLRLIMFSESQIFGLRLRRQYKVRRASTLLKSGLRELQPGDFVVHHEHGIGRYLGLRELAVGGPPREFVELEYAELEKLYVPVEKLHLIDRYIGAGGRARLDRLGGVSWKRVKARIKRSVQHMARDLLRLYAVREVLEGTACEADGPLHHEFAAAFEYEETEDQARAIDDVRRDMERQRPMDRLICGDVGYGKTEVAMRAAFKAVFDHRQVAVLVPTTILAQQHLQTFTQRFAGWPVHLALLSRFVPRPQQKATLRDLAEGKVDIVIGTHRLLQDDVLFKELGLLVVDEEHRFGVAHKERIKRFRNLVDVLTLSATPIPRTMQFALMSIRDLSIINTPPEDRLPVHTYVVKFSTRVIREAIMNELERGGQVFFVHNRVQSIDSMAAVVKSIVPEARVGIAHGQMSERALERVMVRFLRGEFNVLVCTTIIESGLDIPNANTIIMHRADKLGLAQLYQLRGRVGRDRYQASAYLLVPGMDALTDVARKRLRTIEELSELSAGLQLATRDLEIRGAGNILGSEQSGHVAAVGFELYCRLIEEAVAELRGKKPSEIFEADISLDFHGSIPSDYVRDAQERLDLYQRLSLSDDEQEVDAFADELLDRYGGIPDEVEQLIAATRLRILAQRLHLERLARTKEGADLRFHPSTTLEPERLVSFLQTYQRTAKLEPQNLLRIVIAPDGWRETYATLANHLRALGGPC